MVQAVLDALSAPAGAEEPAARPQRYHDALAEAMRWLRFCIMMDVMDDTQADRAEAQLRAGVYARLSETYDAAESVPTQLERGTDHATRRGWAVVATFKDDGYSAFKEITRDGFAELIAAIEAGQVDVVIVRDIDRLTRNLADWNAFEKACVRHGVRLSRLYRRGPGPVHGRKAPTTAAWRRCGRGGKARSRARGSGKPRTGKRGRAGGPAAGERWFGYTRIYANPDEPNHRKRHIVREDINPVEAEAIREAARRVLEDGETVASILRDWIQRGIRPVHAESGGRVAGRHAEIGAAGGAAGVAGQEVPGDGMAGDHRCGHP